MRSSFYRFEDGLYHPQVPATGSWNKRHQNGVAVGGLLTDTLERHPAPQDMLISRLTIDIMRPVPFQPVEVRLVPVREAHRMQVLDAEILADGEVVARASAIR